MSGLSPKFLLLPVVFLFSIPCSERAYGAAAFGCGGEVLQDAVSPAVAAEALSDALGQASLNEAEAEVILAAYRNVVGSNSGYAVEVAGLIALGRPDLMGAIEQQATSFCPRVADKIIQSVEDTAANPSAEQLAALAAEQGATPAAGPDASPQ